MANQEHLDLLKRGSFAWNGWRAQHKEVRPDLSHTDLNYADLSRADLSRADLRYAQLIEADLSGADLSYADLSGAKLNRADLSEADLQIADLGGANLSGANLSGAYFRYARLCYVNLSGANLSHTDLSYADLSRADLNGADLSKAHLISTNLSGADLREAIFFKASLHEANFNEANLSGTDLSVANNLDSTFRYLLSDVDYQPQFDNVVDMVEELIASSYDIRLIKERDITQINLDLVNLSGTKFIAANLSKTNLSRVNLYGAYLNGAKLNGARLNDADLFGADLFKADLCGANLSNANLSGANISEANLSGANLTGCRVYAISAWDVNLTGAIQENMIITSPYMPNEQVITVDNLEVAQFIYLLLNNKKIRDVIDSITSKVVLILGRFTSERKAILDAMRDELRKRNYSPIVFDFEKPANRDFTETVRTLAHLSRFIIADLTDPSSIPQELQAIIPTLAVPVQPVLLEGKREYSMFVDFLKTYHWVLPIHYYTDQANLLTTLEEYVIVPAEQKAQELEKR